MDHIDPQIIERLISVSIDAPAPTWLEEEKHALETSLSVESQERISQKMQESYRVKFQTLVIEEFRADIRGKIASRTQRGKGLSRSKRERDPSTLPMVVDFASRSKTKNVCLMVCQLRLHEGRLPLMRDCGTEELQAYLQKRFDKGAIVLLCSARACIGSGEGCSDRFLGIVTSCNRGRIMIKVSTPQVTPRSMWYVSNLGPCSTTLRELVAIRRAAFSFPDIVLRSTPPTVGRRSKTKTSPPRVEIPGPIRHILNRGQQRAVELALSQPLTLIQGPPGTGKTQMIVGIVNTALTMKRRARGSREPFRILCCCPSNAAIDVLLDKMLRLGFLDLEVLPVRVRPFRNGEIVRVGEESSMSEGALGVCVGRLAKEKISRGYRVRDSHRQHGTRYVQVCREIVRDARVVCCTLGSSGREELMTRRTPSPASRSGAARVDACRGSRLPRGASSDLPISVCGFDLVVVDEACQATEPSTLVAMSHLRDMESKLVLVGDPQQLPATVLSTHAKRYGLDVSLFERLSRAGRANVHQLRVQYRMHPLIRAFPSKHFYGGTIEDKPTVTVEDDDDASSVTSMPFRWHPCHEGRTPFKPWCFFDFPGTKCEMTPRRSYVNRDEAALCADIYCDFLDRFASKKFVSKFAIISPYSGQVEEIEDIIRTRRLQKKCAGVDVDSATCKVSTVDGFQGDEMDFVIISCVRSASRASDGSRNRHTIGFLRDRRRLNVALTRGKFAVWIVGDAYFLYQNKDWKALIDFARDHDRIVRISSKGGLAALKKSIATGSAIVRGTSQSTDSDGDDWGVDVKKDVTFELPVLVTSSAAANRAGTSTTMAAPAEESKKKRPTSLSRAHVREKKRRRTRVDSRAKPPREARLVRWTEALGQFIVSNADAKAGVLLSCEIFAFGAEVDLALLQTTEGTRFMNLLKGVCKRRDLPLSRSAAKRVRQKWKKAVFSKI
eukprot:g369.t1